MRLSCCLTRAPQSSRCSCRSRLEQLLDVEVLRATSSFCMRTALRPLRRWQAVIPAEPGEIGLFGRDPPLNRKLETGDLGPGKPDLCLRLVFRTFLELLARFDFGRAATPCPSDEDGRPGFIAGERSELGKALRRGAVRGPPDRLPSAPH